MADEIIYELKPGLKRCAHRMRYTGNRCQLAKGHVGRHAWEPADEPRMCDCDCHYADSGHLICSRCTRNHGVDKPADETPASYPADWPRCVFCGRPAMDGHLTCGRAGCSEADARDLNQ